MNPFGKVIPLKTGVLATKVEGLKRRREYEGEYVAR